MIKSAKEIQGWCDFYDLYEAVAKWLPENSVIVEVGTWLGASICYLGEQLKILNKKATIHGIDTFKGDETCQFHLDTVAAHGGSIKSQFIQNVSDLGLTINPIEALTLDAAKLFEDNSIDFCFIDAAHDYESVKKDIMAYWPKVKNGGILAGHDYEKGVLQAVHELFNQNKVTRVNMCWVIQKN